MCHSGFFLPSVFQIQPLNHNLQRGEPALELVLHPKCSDSQLPEQENQSPVPIELNSCFCCVFEAPSQPPGNVVWNVTDSRVVLSWEEVRAMDNESEVTGYKVSGDRAGDSPRHCLVCLQVQGMHNPTPKTLHFLNILNILNMYSNSVSPLMSPNPPSSPSWHCSALGIPATPESENI